MIQPSRDKHKRTVLVLVASVDCRVGDETFVPDEFCVLAVVQVDQNGVVFVGEDGEEIGLRVTVEVYLSDWHLHGD